MFPEFLILFIFLALLWFWLDSARACEIGTELAKLVCQREGVQFLDGTVVLTRIRLCTGNEGRRISRVLTFDYSDEDGGRYQGYVQMCGRQVVDVSFGLFVA